MDKGEQELVVQHRYERMRQLEESALEARAEFKIFVGGMLSNDWSQAEVARLLGISRQTLHSIIRAGS
jgi:DNA-binding NtrC family response regulator